MRESEVEKYLISETKKIGGEIRKLQWINRRGAPDRVIFFAGVYFVELKAPGETLRPEQQREHDRMTAQGADVRTLDSKEKIDEFIKAITTRIHT